MQSKSIRLFKVVIGAVTLLSSVLLFTSCASSTNTTNSHTVSHTYEGQNTGGIGWH